MASATAALVGGSFAFVALAVASAIALYFAYRTKRLTKDEVRYDALHRAHWVLRLILRCLKRGMKANGEPLPLLSQSFLVPLCGPSEASAKQL